MSRVERKVPVGIGEVLQEFLRSSRMSAGLNTQRVFAAWDDASGASKFTLKRFYRNGVLYITTSSSVVRSQLEYQKDVLVEKMNAILSADDLFIKNDPQVGYISELRLK